MTAAQKANQLRFKKVQAEAKKLKAKNKKLSHLEAVKKAWAIILKTGSSKKVAGYVKTEKKGTLTKVVYTKKAKKKAAVKQASLFGYKKVAGTKTHKDTKSHNVNIRVVSGMPKIDIQYLNEIKEVYKKIELAEKHLNRNKELLKKDKNMFNASWNGMILKKGLLKDNINLTKYISELKKHKTELKKLV